jgi:hypothetical protein
MWNSALSHLPSSFVNVRSLCKTSSQCPFCLEKLDTLKKTKEHIGQHQVSLALRALGVYSDSGEHGPEDSVKVSSKDTSSQIDPGSQTSQRPVISFQDRIHIWGPITGVLLKETERKRPRTAAQIQHIHEVKSWGASCDNCRAKHRRCDHIHNKRKE